MSGFKSSIGYKGGSGAIMKTSIATGGGDHAAQMTGGMDGTQPKTATFNRVKGKNPHSERGGAAGTVFVPTIPTSKAK